MIIQNTLTAALAALAFAGHVSAATFDGSSGAAANVTDYSADALLSFDIDFANVGAVTLNFTVDASDLVSPQLTFNSLVRNLSGLGFDQVHVSLNGVSFAAPAVVTTDGFATVATQGSGTHAAWASFTPALTSEFYLGNPLGAPSATDWRLNLAGLSAGDRFSVTVAVPEAESYALALAGLSVMGLLARRRRAT